MKTSQDEPEVESVPRSGWRLLGKIVATVFVVGVLLVISFELVYAGKVYPGVSADGVYLGGLPKDAAIARLADKLTQFQGQAIVITYGDQTLRIPVNTLGVKYDQAKVIDLAMQFGRQGSLVNRLHQQLRALVGRPTDYYAVSYSDSLMVTYVNQVSSDVTTPAADATLTFNDSSAQVVPALSGTRLDGGLLTQAVMQHLATTDNSAFAAPVYQLAPLVTTDALKAASSQANGYLAGPITLTYNSKTYTVDPKDITTWLKTSATTHKDFLLTHDVADLYPPDATTSVTLDKGAVADYVGKLAAKIDQSAQDAALDIVDGKATVFQLSHDGYKVDQAATVSALNAALAKPASDRTIALKVDVTKAAVNETNLADLGINELISEGVTYFPGSPPNRLTNVRVGAKQFNGVLLKPDEVFSFGAILGDVGPEQGYVPGLVILGDKEVKQYGGGLCQVSSTAYRAALLAGLPILQRTNHLFAISYYTWPYSVPGVDAALYYPDVDVKFKNDTGHYILIQTVMQGYTLKFDFYGTKTKTGVIRGPQFVTGSNDATVPSHTVFWRDVLDLAGNVTKTDRVDTYYKSSLDFPVSD